MSPIGNDEVQPWLTRLNERALQRGFLGDRPKEPLCEHTAKRMFEDLLLPLLHEMAGAISRPDRLRRLVEDLKKYRNDRWSAGDQETARMAMGAVCYIEREDSPAQNTFLLSLCLASLQSAMGLIETEEARLG